MRPSIQNLWKWFFETVLVLALVVSSFLILLSLLNLFFPSGQNLFEVIRVGGEEKFRPSAGIPEDRQILVGVGDRQKDLARMNNSVQSRRSNEIAWVDARPGMTLSDRDAVQTGKRSSARLTFGGNNYLEMHENSLMVIRNLERDIFLNTARTVAVLVEGQFKGEIGKSDSGSFDVELVTAGAVARFPAPQDSDQPASFKMIVNRDESSILTVLHGKADLLFQDTALEVGANQIVKVQPGKQPVFLPPPPPPPEPVLPEEGETFAYRDVPPRVSFTWKGSEDSLQYRFILAADEKFEHIVYEQVTGRRSFSHGSLKPGEYYWRVSGIGVEEEGGFSPVRRLQMVQDLQPPKLEVRLAEGSLRTGDVVLAGTTDPDAEVFVGGVPVVVNDHGDFDYRLELKNGWNVIVVEAVDQVGNVAYFSRTLNVEDKTGSFR
jgi:hypothetical protein